MGEPILTSEDRRKWDFWEASCRAHARSALHAKRVEEAMTTVAEMQAHHPEAYIALSGGKDSTAMCFLLAKMGLRPRVVTVHHDMHWPDMLPHCKAVCERLGMPWEVAENALSWRDFIGSRKGVLDPTEAALGAGGKGLRSSRREAMMVYPQRWNYPGVYIGLRKDESKGRRMNYAVRGTIYERAEGQARHVVCQPLARWSVLDVGAFLFAEEAPWLDAYRCCRLHGSPGDIRTGSMIPYEHATRGAVVWMKTYYPSLFHELCGLFPTFSSLA